MKHKKGLIGGFISMFTATIVVVLILILYAVAGTFISKTGTTAGDIIFLSQEDIGLGPLLKYEGYTNIIEVKTLLQLERTLAQALREVYYNAP